MQIKEFIKKITGDKRLQRYYYGTKISKITNNNSQGEYYLTDTIKIALEEGLSVNSYVAKTADVILGANDPKQLEELNKRAEQIFG